MPNDTLTLADPLLAEREAYQRDGAIVLRGVLDLDWVERMRRAIGRLNADNPDVRLWMARFDSEFDAFARHSGLAAVAGDMMGVDRVHFLYDQLFVKQPQSDNPTPLHQDLPRPAHHVWQQEVGILVLPQLLLRQPGHVCRRDGRALSEESPHEPRRMHGRIDRRIGRSSVIHQARHQVNHHGDDSGADDDAKHYLDYLVVLLKKTNHA